MAIKVWVVKDERGRWYTGDTEGGTPVCDSLSRFDALELYNEDLERDFPNGLPAGWTKEEA
jgi:hypothetical protein